MKKAEKEYFEKVYFKVAAKLHLYYLVKNAENKGEYTGLLWSCDLSTFLGADYSDFPECNAVYNFIESFFEKFYDISDLEDIKRRAKKSAEEHFIFKTRD